MGINNINGSNSELKIITWNVRGLGKITKIKQVMTKINQLNPSIVFLQECHISSNDTTPIQRRWKGQLYSALYSPNSRGVMILIHKLVPLQISRVLQDTAGRYIIIQGSLFNENMILTNVYGPNIDCPSFFEKLFLLIASLPGKLIMAGDFNCTISPNLDRSTCSDTTHTQSRKKIGDYIKELNLCDPWRRLNPSKRTYSCCSTVTKGHSRIDYFLISNDLFSRITMCQYEPIVISDHGPVSLIYKTEGSMNETYRWHLHSKWLHDPDFIKFIEEQIDNFFKENKDETSAAIRWEAFKAYIRGQIISYTNSKSNKFKLELNLLEKEIKMEEEKTFK